MLRYLIKHEGNVSIPETIAYNFYTKLVLGVDTQSSITFDVSSLKIPRKRILNLSYTVRTAAPKLNH